MPGSLRRQPGGSWPLHRGQDRIAHLKIELCHYLEHRCEEAVFQKKPVLRSLPALGDCGLFSARSALNVCFHAKRDTVYLCLIGRR